MIFTVKSRKQTELIDITTKIQDVVLSAGIGQGLCMLYVPHTTAAITINEIADPSVKEDILMIIGKGKRAIEEHFDRNFELEQQLLEQQQIKEAI